MLIKISVFLYLLFEVYVYMLTHTHTHTHTHIHTHTDTHTQTHPRKHQYYITFHHNSASVDGYTDQVLTLLDNSELDLYRDELVVLILFINKKKS